jgi:hypothetical protein
MSDLMTAYLDQLTRELSFDPSLARRMRAEAEDHLQEAVASDPMGVTTEAERRAIARFGAARDIAAQCAVPSLVKQVKNAGAAATLIAVGVLIAMKIRMATYAATSQIVSDDPTLDRLRTVISTIDRYAFWCGLLIAFCGWAYVSIVCASDEARLVWRKRLRLSLLTYAAAAVAVVITVASDTILTALRLLPAGQVAMLFPCLTIGLEAALAIALVLRLRVTMQRLASSARLFAV